MIVYKQVDEYAVTGFRMTCYRCDTKWFMASTDSKAECYLWCPSCRHMAKVERENS
jgi:hypothetical protein